MRKLFSLLAMMVVTITAMAQTGTLQNANFSEGLVADASISSDGMKEVPSWRINSANGQYRAGAVVAYGSTSFVGYAAPSAGPEGSNGQGLAVLSAWTNTTQYVQDVTLAAGKYKMTVPVYNAAGNNGFTKNLIGVKYGETEKYATTLMYPVGAWTVEAVEFELTEETEVTVSLGYEGANVSNSASQHLFIDCVKLEAPSAAPEVTVNPSFIYGVDEVALSAESAVSVEGADAIKVGFGESANVVKYASYIINEVVDAEGDGAPMDITKPLITKATQFHSPMTTDDEQTDGDIDAVYPFLLDGDLETYWHSSWEDGNQPMGTHYLQVSDIEEESIVLVMTRRPVSNDHVTSMSVWGYDSADDAIAKTQGVKLAEIELPFGANNETLTSAPFQTQGKSVLRFYAETTYGTGASNRGYWHCSEFQLYPATDGDGNQTQETPIATGQLNLNGFGYAEFDQTLFFKAGTKYNLEIKAWDSEDIFNPDFSIKDPVATFTCDFNGAYTSTSSELVNADFAQGVLGDLNVATYEKDGTPNHMQEVPGWSFGVNNIDARAGGVVAYGSGTTFGGASYGVPAEGPEGTNGKALAVLAVWTGTVQYVQNVTLPAGKYKMTVPVFNTAGTTDFVKNLIGVKYGETEKYATTLSYPVGAWTVEAVEFELDEETEVTVSLGYEGANCGAGAAQHLYYDCVKIDTPAPSEVKVTTNLDDVEIKSTADFEGIEITFEGATTVEVNPSFEDDGTSIAIYNSEASVYDFLHVWNPIYNDLWNENCAYTVEGNKITITGFFNYWDYASVGTRKQAKRKAEQDPTKAQYIMYLDGFVIDGTPVGEFELFFNAGEESEKEPEPVDLDKVYVKSQAGEYFGIAGGQVAVVKEPFAWTFAERTGEGNENAYQLCDYDETYWINTGSNGYLSTAKISETNNIRNYYFYEATATETTVTGKLVEAPMKDKDYMIVVKNVNKSPNNGLYAIYCSLASGKTDRFDVVKISDDETVIPAEFTLTTESESSNGAIDFQKVVWNLLNEDTTGIATATTTATTDAIFSITGQRIMKLQKGINIVGGKKVIR